jgi:hypothetical protein
MKHQPRHHRLFAAALCLFGASALPAAAQEPLPPPRPEPPVEPETPPVQPEQPPVPEKPRLELPPMPGAEADDLQKELLQLFGKVENRLRAIDTQMYEAAAGRVPTKPVAGSGIEELLRSGQQAKQPQNVAELLQSASQDSRQTQTDIQRILQIAESMNSKSKSGSSGGSKPKPGSDGKSPLDRPGGRDPSGREQTPDQPGSKPESKPKSEGETPKDGKHPDDPNRPTRNREGELPPDLQKGPGSSGSGADRWGDLPVRAREIFRVEGASDLPPQYRDWIDGYYRRLQTLERR